MEKALGVFVVAVMALATTQAGLVGGPKCYICSNKSSDGECNFVTKKCISNRQVCHTEVTGGLISKRCMNARQCWSAHKGKCEGENCAYCCNTDLCNDVTPAFSVYGGLASRRDTCDPLSNPCDSQPCLNGGSCHISDPGYDCECLPGYEGPHCEETMNPCESTPCKNCGTCVNHGPTDPRCICPPGYTGEYCDQPTCHPGCFNGGTCEDGGCICPPEFTGEHCRIPIPSCIPRCENGGTCIDGVCQCPDGYDGPVCEYPPCDPECINGGICDKGECICPPGYCGPDCGTPIDPSHPCDPNPCYRGGTCIEIGDRFRCECPENTAGPRCAIETPCRPRCENGGTCINGECECPDGYDGPVCEYPPCDPECRNGGRCHKGECICPPGYCGPDCGNPIDPSHPCDPNPCYRGGTCIEIGDRFRCECPENTAGPRCAIEAPCWPRCENGGTCINGECECPDGYDGPVCEYPPCDPECLNGGRCHKGECICPPGYCGPDCGTPIDPSHPCDPNPCYRGGTCIEIGDRFRCECPENTAGPRCAIEAPCLPRCENGATCIDGVCEYPPCDPECINGGVCDRGECICPPGYCGPDCGNPIDPSHPCDPNPCYRGGTCIEDGDRFRCECPEDTTGPRCVPLCLPRCENGGVCIDGECQCPEGFTGEFCETEIPCYPGCPDGRRCIRDRCVEIPCQRECQNGGKCIGDYCLCRPGYTGDDCETEISPCDENPCLSGGTCLETSDGFECECPDGFSGPLCGRGEGPCDPNPCLNGGTCRENRPGFQCDCPFGYDGPRCGHETCDVKPCQNNGTCYDGSCYCPPSYTGPFCGHLIRPPMGYNCYTNNPCVPWAIIKEYYHWPHHNPCKFLQCDDHGGCYPMDCQPDTCWDPITYTCNDRNCPPMCSIDRTP